MLTIGQAIEAMLDGKIVVGKSNCKYKWVASNKWVVRQPNHSNCWIIISLENIVSQGPFTIYKNPEPKWVEVKWWEGVEAYHNGKKVKVNNCELESGETYLSISKESITERKWKVLEEGGN